MANGLFNLKQVMQGIQQNGWVAQKPPAVDYLIVAGGGGGALAGAQNTGGGGAGGLLTGSVNIASATSYTVTIGAGAATSGEGGNSFFGPTGALGGGRAGNQAAPQSGGNGTAGGSGGGGNSFPSYGGSGTPGQGHPH